MIRKWFKPVFFVLAALGLGGLLVAVSGIISLKASTGHWPITRWFLVFTKERSLATHTLGIKAPSLKDPALILKGAGHYQTACMACHGAPGIRQPRVAQKMLPPPPNLARTVSNWSDAELFYIIKHGLKFTGMPAWPTAERDDEVWAMVAFLRQLPVLDETGYRRLAIGEALPAKRAPVTQLHWPTSVPRGVLESCARCHGNDGLGRAGLAAFPKLAGQSEAYLRASLEAYATGDRYSGIMEPVAAGASPEDIRALARYFSSLPRPKRSPVNPDQAEAVKRGEAIARLGIPARRVPSCMECHGPGKSGRNPAYPELAGQFAGYIELQLKLFKEKRRGGSAYARLMHPVVADMTEEQMQDVAAYYAALEGLP